MNKIIVFLFLAFLQQQSFADVTKFKVNKAIINYINKYGEVWVNRNNGDIYVHGGKKTSDDIFNFNEIDDSIKNELTHIIRADIACSSQKIGKDDAIFCKKDGVITIIHNINISCQTQFDNVVKSGLLDNGKFNRHIFHDPFVGTGWKMPSISAYIAPGSSTTDVYCAMKAKYLNNDNFWKTYNINGKNDYTQSESRDFYNYEHTERQLVVNYMTDFCMSSDGNIEYSEEKILVPAGRKMRSLKGGDLFIWTKSNPCTSAIEANGGNCCVNWYREVREILADHNTIYFFKLSNNALPKAGYIREKSVIEEIMRGSTWLLNNPKCRRLKRHNELEKDVLSDMAITYFECVGNVCDDVHDEIEAAFNADMPEGIRFIMSL